MVRPAAYLARVIRQVERDRRSCVDLVDGNEEEEQEDDKEGNTGCVLMMDSLGLHNQKKFSLIFLR